MIEIAKGASKGIKFTCDWDKIKKTDNATLILSSVIHEVMHYSNLNEVQDFWNKIHNSNFKYIVIRDMIPSKSIDRPSDMNDVRKLYNKSSYQLETFENIWGSIENNKALVHFLLKYRYTANWNREVRENYMPLYREDIMRGYPPLNEYEIVYHEHYILPYLKWQVKKDFDIDIKDNTHLKLVLKRK